MGLRGWSEDWLGDGALRIDEGVVRMRRWNLENVGREKGGKWRGQGWLVEECWFVQGRVVPLRGWFIDELVQLGVVLIGVLIYCSI